MNKETILEQLKREALYVNGIDKQTFRRTPTLKAIVAEESTVWKKGGDKV